MAQQKFESVSVIFPTARLVQGSVLTGNDKDQKGNLLTWKSGKNKGEQRYEFIISIAIEKQGEDSWRDTEWGAQLYQVACDQAPDFIDRDDFAYKIVDGDSTKKMSNNKRPCDITGFPGHWIVRMKGNYAPKQGKFDDSGNVVEVAEKDFIKRGYYVQVGAEVSFNGDDQKPGIYINQTAVVFVAYGEVIMGAQRDMNTMGFKQQANLPAGATTKPSAPNEKKSVTPNSEARTGSKPLPPKPGAKPLPPKKPAYKLEAEYSGTVEQFLEEYGLSIDEALADGYISKA